MRAIKNLLEKARLPLCCHLLGLSVKKDMLYYLFFNNEGELITQKFSLPKS